MWKHGKAIRLSAEEGVSPYPRMAIHMWISRMAQRTGDIPRLFFPGGIRPHNTCFGIRIPKKNNQYLLPLLATTANDGPLDPTVKRHLLPPQIPCIPSLSFPPFSRAIGGNEKVILAARKAKGISLPLSLPPSPLRFTQSTLARSDDEWKKDFLRPRFDFPEKRKYFEGTSVVNSV